MIVGSGRTADAAVECRSWFVLLVKVPSKRSSDVVPAVARKIRRLPAELKSTVTSGRGKEMSRQVDFTVATGVQVYFADLHSSWQ